MLKIFLSAGHSNTDPGAVANGVSEASLTLQLRDALTLALADRGIAVMTDGRRGENLALRDAVKIAAKNPDGLNLEFHFNAGPPGASGVEVLSHARHKRTAQAIAGAIASATRSPLRGENGWKPENAGQHHRLAFVQAGGLIIETCFISNPKDLGAYRARFDDVVNVLAGTIAQMAKGIQTGQQIKTQSGASLTGGSSSTSLTGAPSATTHTVTYPATPVISTQITPLPQAPAPQPSKPSIVATYQASKLIPFVLATLAAIWQQHRTPLLMTGAFVLGLVVAWQFKPIIRERL